MTCYKIIFTNKRLKYTFTPLVFNYLYSPFCCVLLPGNNKPSLTVFKNIVISGSVLVLIIIHGLNIPWPLCILSSLEVEQSKLQETACSLKALDTEMHCRSGHSEKKQNI